MNMKDYDEDKISVGDVVKFTLRDQGYVRYGKVYLVKEGAVYMRPSQLVIDAEATNRSNQYIVTRRDFNSTTAVIRYIHEVTKLKIEELI